MLIPGFRQLSIILLSAFCLVCSLAAPAGAVTQPRIEFEPRTYQCVRAYKAPEIDGLADDAAWQNAAWTDDFVDIEGADAAASALRTRVRMLWDAEALYVFAELQEPAIQATLTEHDSVIFHDNDFELFIDPDADNHMYAELEINALGTVWDLLLSRPYRDGGHAIDNWDIRGLHTAVSLDGTANDASDTDEGWSVEMAIPWSVLEEIADCQVPPVAGDRWHMNFSRVQYGSQIEQGRHVRDTGEDGSELDPDNWVWSPQGVVAMHCPEMWGIVEFAGGIVMPGNPELLSEDYARQALMCLYYWQHDFHDGHGTYSQEKIDHWYDAYQLPEVDLFRDWLLQDEMSASRDFFRFSMSDGRRSLSVDQSGKISVADHPLTGEAIPVESDETVQAEQAAETEPQAPAPAEEEPATEPVRSNPVRRDGSPE